MTDEELEKKRKYHRDYNRIYMREWSKNNPEKVRAIYVRTREKDRLSKLITCTKQTAKKKGIEHNITKEDLVKVLHCPLTGVEIDWSVSGRHLLNPSVDRIDPTKGYIKGNVEIVSCLGNTMKSNATPGQLVHFAKEILKRYGNDV